MKRIALFILSLTICLGPTITKAADDSINAQTTFDFQKDDILQTLRFLAHKAGINLIIGDGISGTITTHLENKTPLEVIEIIALGKGLDFKEQEGVYYLTKKPDSTKSKPTTTP